jgi:hypothetical protein
MIFHIDARKKLRNMIDIANHYDRKRGFACQMRNLFYSLKQSIFHFDAVQLFQHRLSGHEDENHRWGLWFALYWLII